MRTDSDRQTRTNTDTYKQAGRQTDADRHTHTKKETDREAKAYREAAPLLY